MSVSPDIFKTVEEGEIFQLALASAVRITLYRYRPYVEEEDLGQMCWLWAYERRDTRLRELMDHSKPVNRERMIRNALCNHLAEWARREKAHKSGYKPEDEVFYTLATLRALMPDVYNRANWSPSSPADLAVSLSTGTDPAEGNNLLATFADITRALGELSKDDQRLLFRKFCVGDSDEALGLEYGVPVNTAKTRVRAALGRLRKELGGARPVDDSREYIGSRRVISNAAAQAITGEYT